MRILLLSDIHGNFPALAAVWHHFQPSHKFDAIVNCGDSLVYAPFPNETLNWLRQENAHCIVGNTDRKVVQLLKGKDFKKPSKEEKRIMYLRTATDLSPENRSFLCGLKKKKILEAEKLRIGLWHGSPQDAEEFLFPTTSRNRFMELAKKVKRKGIDIVVTGHSHTPYHLQEDGIHFINPGSVGRMFDGNPQASCAVLTISGRCVEVEHHRLKYPIEQVITELRRQKFPEIYCRMYELGQKLN